MSDRELEADADNTANLELEAEIAKLKARHAKKAKLTEVLERGLVGDRLYVPLPPHIHGEWVPKDKLEIWRKESMGFKIDTEYASKRALHDGGSGGESVVGDCIFMTVDSETQEIIEEIRKEQYDAANSPRGGKQKEERDFENLVREVGLPVDDKNKSRVDTVNADNIREALTSKD